MSPIHLQADRNLPHAAIETATVALARVDERLARGETVLAEGALARAHIFEAQALVGLAGGSVALEDMVLHDAGMDVHLPTAEVLRAVSILQQRRSLAGRPAKDSLTEHALHAALGLTNVMAGGSEPSVTGSAPPPSPSRAFRPWEMPQLAAGENEDEPDNDLTDAADEPPLVAEADDLADEFTDVDALLLRSRRALDAFNDLTSAPGRAQLKVTDPAHDGAGRLAAWRQTLAATEGQPAVWAAAVALDAWLLLEPSERSGELGFLLAAQVLRQRGLVTQHMPTLGLGLRKAKVRWTPHHPQRVRVESLLSAFSQSAVALGADLDRLDLARQVMLRKCAGKRGNSRLHELVDCFTASPLLTVQMAARQLGVSPQGIEVMMGELGSALPREITGRKRYRAWGIL